MGMFDSLYDKNGIDWQTKAFECLLTRYDIGSTITAEKLTFQVEVLGEPEPRQWPERGVCVDSYATIRDGILTEVPAARDESLPLQDYSGHWLAAPEGA
jgi:hypothetical protein